MTKEIEHINEVGKVVNPMCSHPNKIPGLDADFCRTCQTWWFNSQIRKQILESKKRPNNLH